MVETKRGCNITLNDDELHLIRLALLDAEFNAKEMAADKLTAWDHPEKLKALRLRFSYFYVK